MKKPRCPKGAAHGVVEIKYPGQEDRCKRAWVCLNCDLAVIGDAPFRDPDAFESFTLGPEEGGELDPT